MEQITSTPAQKDPESTPVEDIKLCSMSASNDELEQTDVHLQLRQAAAEQKLEKVKSLLQNGADPTKCDENERNALHHACRHDLEEETNIEDLLKLLLNKGCKKNINDTDIKGNTALWYAIEYRNSRAAITLIENGADFTSRLTRDKCEGNTAFHEACLAGLFDVVERMFCSATNGSNPVHLIGHCDATPLHAACKNSHLEIVKKLIEKGADITAEDKTGKTPLHDAASGIKSEGTIETVDYLLKHGSTKILNKPSSEEESKTPLSTACFYGHHETVKFLLDKGAVVDKNCMKYAVEKDFNYTARVLINSSQWRKCLRQILPSGDPIMNEIIRKMPEVAADVLDKCTVRRKQRSDEEGCAAFNFEFLECFKETRSAFEDESMQSRTSDYVRDPEGLANHHAKKDIEKKEKEFEDVIKQRQQWFGPQWGLQRFKKSQHPLAVIVKSGNYHLLTHPVVRALLYYKWMPYGFLYYIMNLVIFLLFLVFATSYSLSVATPFSQECPAQGNGTCNIPESKQSGIQFAAVMTILFAIIRLVMRLGKEFILMFKFGLKYFVNIHVLLDWTDVPSYVFIIIFALIFPYDCPCPPAWQWQIGIIGLFLAWITLLKFANKFPIISKYVLMFGRILETFVKVALSIGIPLVLAFAWPFYMALHDPEVSRSPFQNAGIAIAKVLSMTTGNFDYDNTFRRDSSGESDFEDELSFLPVTYILWIIFIILMPILLNNLLVGLAIGDIKSVEEHAELRKLALKVELVLEFEELLLPYFRSKLRTGHKIVYPWKPRRLKWFKQEHEFPEVILQVSDRKQHHAGKHNGRYRKNYYTEHHHTTEHLVKHATAHKSRYEFFGGEHGQGDLQTRLERVEDLLERMAEKMHVPIL